MAPFRLVVKTTKMALMVLVFFSLVYWLSHFRLVNYFPIQLVRIYGVNHLDREEIQNALTPLVTNGFFNVNLDAVRDRILQTPWVEDVFVRREWPSKINVTVVEKQATARWNDNMLLSSKGNIFEPEKSTYPADIPVFHGPPGKQTLMLQFYNDINRILTPLHAKISFLEVTPYLSWKLTLDNGIKLQMGQKNMLNRLDHLVRVYPNIVGDRAGDVEYIDLRYPNGVAVRWRGVIKT